MIVVDGDQSIIRSAAVSLRAAGFGSVERWVLHVWNQLLVGGLLGEPIPWISPGVVALAFARIFFRSPGITYAEPLPVLDAWISRLARSRIARVVFSRFDWSDIQRSTDRYLSVLFSRSQVHLETIGTVIWVVPTDMETLHRELNAELECDQEAVSRPDPAFSAIIEAMTSDLLHRAAPGAGLEARLHYPEIVDDVDMERMVAVWDETVEKTLQRLGPIATNQPIAMDAIHVKDELSVANGYRDIEPRAPGAWDALVPSELALMEETGEIDLFDLKAAENELLHFVADDDSEKRMRRDIIFYTEIVPHQRSLFLRADITGWFMAWWELALRVLFERMAGDQLEFTLSVGGVQPLRWQKLVQLLVSRVRTVIPEVSITARSQSAMSVTARAGVTQTWWIAPFESVPSVPHVIHCPSEGPQLNYLSATTHTASVTHRYTNQLVELLDTIELGGRE